MAFHRLSAPGYFGGLPVGYDYINDPVTNGDAGVAAFADSKKASGVNAGTYFVAFGEDATSSFANRGMKALAANTDALDDLLHRDLAMTAHTSDVTVSGSPVASIVIAGQIFVGDSGVSNTQAQRDLLISVLDGNDNEILVGTAKVQASLIHDGASNNVVGTQASGFYSTVTVALNVSLPVGQTYRVYYGFRGNLATLPKDAFTSIRIRGAQEVEASVEKLFRDLHSTAAGTLWDDPWVATINSLARTGLDGRYRLSTTDPGATPTLNTPGNGSSIVRDGTAVTLLSPTYDLTAFGTVGVNRYPDPQLASFRVKRQTPVTSTAYDTKLGGDVGLYQESPFHNLADALEIASSHVAGPLVLDAVPRNVTGSTLSAHTVATRITALATAQVNAGAGTDATSRRTLTLASGDFFRNGAGKIGLRKNDLLEITDTVSGFVVGTFRLDTILSDTTATVKTVTGAIPPLGPSGAAANIRVRWIQPTVSIGGQARVGSADPYGMSSLFVAQPGLLTDGYDAENIGIASLMLSAMSQRSLGATNELLFTAMGWGGYDNLGAFGVLGTLLGDGGITTSGGRQTLNQLRRRPQTYAVPNGGTATFTLNPVLQGTSVTMTPAVAPTSATALTFVVNTSAGYSPQDGDEIDLTLVMLAGTTGAVTITWPADFIFSGYDGLFVSTNPALFDCIIQWAFKYKLHVPIPGWYAERMDW